MNTFLHDIERKVARAIYDDDSEVNFIVNTHLENEKVFLGVKGVDSKKISDILTKCFGVDKYQMVRQCDHVRDFTFRVLI